MQHITYNEFLPRVIGWNNMNLYTLRVQVTSYNFIHSFIHSFSWLIHFFLSFFLFLLKIFMFLLFNWGTIHFDTLLHLSPKNCNLTYATTTYPGLVTSFVNVPSLVHFHCPLIDCFLHSVFHWPLIIWFFIYFPIIPALYFHQFIPSFPWLSPCERSKVER